MDRLNSELHRLFGHPPAGGKPAPTPDAPEGHRLFCVAVCRPGDWEQAATIFRGVQEDLDLPAPAVSVDGRGFRLWFPLAEPVSSAQGNAFLTHLVARYAADLPSDRIEAGAADPAQLPPAQLAGDERWSAFIDPSMGSMFTAEPWLDMAPPPDKQAELLAGFARIKPQEFARALARLAPAFPPLAGNARPPENHSVAPDRLTGNGPHADPQSFLLAVMNDPNASPALRVEAAKALLPYYRHPLSH